MMGGRWFLGVDIQPRQLMAVALSVQRDGFRLRGCVAAWLRGCVAAWLRGCVAGGVSH